MVVSNQSIHPDPVNTVNSKLPLILRHHPVTVCKWKPLPPMCEWAICVVKPLRVDVKSRKVLNNEDTDKSLKEIIVLCTTSSLNDDSSASQTVAPVS